MTYKDSIDLERAIDAVKKDKAEIAELDAASARLAAHLGIEDRPLLQIETIRGCEDIRQLLPAHAEGKLSLERDLLVEAHLNECVKCRHYAAGEIGEESVNWSLPQLPAARPWSAERIRWALAACLALMIISFGTYKAIWEVPQGPRAHIQRMEGGVYRLTSTGDEPLRQGAELRQGDFLRTSGNSRAYVQLVDGSVIEASERSVFDIEARGRNVTIGLEKGSVIVQASKRRYGHLYVKTPDCRVAVTGTIFSVSAGMKGSRVGVIQGAVHVVHGGHDMLLHAGDQTSTSESMTPLPVSQQVSWSQDRQKYLSLLAEFAQLQQRFEQIPMPAPRYTSDLLTRMPANTVLYVSIPNLGETLSEANTIFHDQLQKSPVLREWWSKAHPGSDDEFNAMIERVRRVSQYFGSEFVITGMNLHTEKSFALLADVTRPGLADLLRQELSSNNAQGVEILTPAELGSVSATPGKRNELFILIREHEVVFTPNPILLKQLNAQLDAGASGFGSGQFGSQIQAAYTRGAGFILAADLQTMIQDTNHNPRSMETLQNSGLGDMRYLIAEHREESGQPRNHLNLQFAGERHGAASWLAAPASIGSLDFVSPNASLAVAFLSKEPAGIVDDLMKMMSDPKAQAELEQKEEQLQLRLREDLAAHFGGDAAFALDGPILPTPSWKAVVEVHDATQLEASLEKLAQAISTEQQNHNQKGVVIERTESDGRTYYAIQNLARGITMLHYTFAEGYMIAGPNRAILMDAIQTHSNYDSLSRSSAFRALLPTDQNENYSAVAYQNLSPVLAPLASQLKSDSLSAIQTLAADAHPTVICAWGEANRIEAGSNSRLFGFDLLALGALMNDGNHNTPGHVTAYHERN